jgi:mannose-1-phosphate guanylyltransferase/mannose-6-phosphate isomerase
MSEKFTRPWGYYHNLWIDQGCSQVKRIVVNPGGKLSLQSHNHRSEHWIIVKGKILATLENQIKELTINNHIFIPVGKKHRIENNTDKIAELIEVQTGTILEETDIIRYEDIYGRVSN